MARAMERDRQEEESLRALILEAFALDPVPEQGPDDPMDWERVRNARILGGRRWSEISHKDLAKVRWHLLGPELTAYYLGALLMEALDDKGLFDLCLERAMLDPWPFEEASVRFFLWRMGGLTESQMEACRAFVEYAAGRGEGEAAQALATFWRYYERDAPPGAQAEGE
jgi:hypothetical protein